MNKSKRMLSTALRNYKKEYGELPSEFIQRFIKSLKTRGENG